PAAGRGERRLRVRRGVKMMTRRLPGALALVVGLLLAAGCKAPPKPARFNNDISRANQKLAGAGKEFRSKLEPLSKGQQVNAGDARTAYQAGATAVAAVKKDYDEGLVPNRSSSAPAVLDKYKAFLSGQQKIVDGPMKLIVAIVEDPNKDPGTKWREIKS